MKVGDVVWVRGTVTNIGPKVIQIACTGPGGASIPYAFDPEGPIMPDDPDTPPG